MPDAFTREAIAPLHLASLDEISTDGAARCACSTFHTAIIGNGRTSRRRTDDQISESASTSNRELVHRRHIYLHRRRRSPDRRRSSARSNALYQFLWQRLRAEHLERQLTERTRELKEVSDIGIALSTVRDHSVLLTMIPCKARELSRADAGSLYLLDDIPAAARCCAGSSRRTIPSTWRPSESLADHAHTVWPDTWP